MSSMCHTIARAGLALVAIVTTGCAEAPAPAATAAAAPNAPVVLARTTKVAAGITSLERINGASALIIGMTDGQIGVWNGRDGALTITLKPHSARVLGVGSSADGRDVWSVAADGTLARTAVTAGATPTTQQIDLGAAPTRAAAFSADGGVLVTGGEFGDLRVFDTATGALRHVLRGHRTEIQAIALRPGSSTVASASAESDLRIWDAATGRELNNLDGDLSLFAIGFSPSGDKMASGGVDRRVMLRNAVTLATTGEFTLQAPRMVGSLAWSPDGRFLALSDIDDETLSKGGVEIIDAASRTVVARLDGGNVPATHLTVLPNAMVVAAAGPTLRAWDVPVLKTSLTN